MVVTYGDPMISSWVIAIFAAFFVAFVIFIIASYIYTSFAYMYIAKRAKVKHPGLAWIPGIGPNIIACRASKMHWWPWLLYIGFFFFALLPPIYFICLTVFTVYQVIWHWKMFERVSRPGWWALLCLIPIVNLVMIGIAAWGKK